ncbi:MAG: hypothetical protein COA88_10340 [Kordia sp.]|nr:MAG: hypothetical protein COA88_10340 [Kordia sp.]
MILPLLLAIVIVAFGVYMYKFPPVLRCNCTKETICMDYSNEPMSELGVALIHEMVGGYENNQLKHINNSANMDDAHSIWFDLETIKAFVYHTEINARNNEVKSDILGLRIYYSRYPEQNQWGNYKDLVGTVDGDYQKRHTLVMVPTINRGKGDIDFNPLDLDTYIAGLKNIEAYADTNPSSTVKTLAFGINNFRSSSTSSGAQNHGGLFPPEPTDGHAFK